MGEVYEVYIPVEADDVMMDAATASGGGDNQGSNEGFVFRWELPTEGSVGGFIGNGWFTSSQNRPEQKYKTDAEVVEAILVTGELSSERIAAILAEEADVDLYHYLLFATEIMAATGGNASTCVVSA